MNAAISANKRERGEAACLKRGETACLERGKAACLVDIRDVQVDACLPKFERIVEYIRQIKNPYHFKCGDFTVKVKYAENGVTLEDCLERLAGAEIRPKAGEFQNAPARHASGLVK